ncbi:hypothetical protein MVEN_01713200 [Mycena venus]|uniref:Protein kinase domain-containing protein n=1 Tax=Mycena venus TaxID=2733690 RepID=A0A8H6XPR5_9AGAR|nr:hypothetical protein MVEN_01713200 [Mycena venus]
MAGESHPEDEFMGHPTTDNAASTFGMFSNSHHFTITAGNLVNITNEKTLALTVPSDYRRIPVGDIDLLREIMLDSSCITHCQRERPRVRRVYTAKIEGRKSNVTVAIYQGEGAQEEWWEDMERYSRLRHPNIVQLCHFASSLKIQAVVFNDDLILLQHFLELHHHSPILTVYIHGFCNTDFKEVQKYFHSTFQQDLYDFDCTIWIRRSTGRLYADLIPYTKFSSCDVDNVSHPQGFIFMDPLGQEAMAIGCLTLDQYHQICYHYISSWRFISISTDVMVNPGAVIACSSSDQLQGWVEIASLPDVNVACGDWRGADGEVLEDGWTRFNSSDVLNRTLSANMWYYNGRCWLSQANHVFTCFGITSNFDDYFFVKDIYFSIQIFATTQDEPSGYLFLCPIKNFQTGPSSFRWPDFPAFWSLDPAGHENLSAEEATRLGFPSLRLETKLHGDSWPASVYAGLRQFHQGKGFDPNSQDVARHLGDPLYQTSAEVDPPSAHIDPDDGQTEPSNLYDDIPSMLFLI